MATKADTVLQSYLLQSPQHGSWGSDAGGNKLHQ